MVCPFKKNVTTITTHETDGTRTEKKTVTFGNCEEFNCPHYRGLRECGLMRGKA